MNLIGRRTIIAMLLIVDCGSSGRCLGPPADKWPILIPRVA
jgi:hypothetical protein